MNNERKSWDAIWVKAEELIREGILISPSMANDHYALTLQVTIQIFGCKRAPTSPQKGVKLVFIMHIIPDLACSKPQRLQLRR